MKRIMLVVGARPNFMKIAPISRAMRRRGSGFEAVLVHTGQHYDANMSRVFFKELGLPAPDVNLEVGSGTQAEQTARILRRFEPVAKRFAPDWVVVPGDVNSTLAGALVAAKLGIRVAHVEAGLRSFDRTMPEEINRVLTDHLSDLLFAPSRDAVRNLEREGIDKRKIHFVGNVMIDTLVRLLRAARVRRPALARRLGLAERYVLVTLHRPSNVDDPCALGEIMGAMEEIGRRVQVVFPVHPRTRRRLGNSGAPGVKLMDPIGYLDFLSLESRAALVLTDSGGVQEETTFLGVPCLTARTTTERPVTVAHGTNHLVAIERRAIVKAAWRQLSGGRKRRRLPEKWDGNAVARIVQVLERASGGARPGRTSGGTCDDPHPKRGIIRE